MMQPQVVHEVEVHRQHVRLKIPVQVEIDGLRYQADDWSVGGFGVESIMTSRRPGERFPVRMIFPFEDFELSMRFDVRMVYADQEHGRFGCAFVKLSAHQAAVFRYLVDAYLSGEMVSAGDILQIRSRESGARPRLPPIHAPFADDEPWLHRARRYALYAALGLAGPILAGIVTLGLYGRLLAPDPQVAVVDGDLVQLRAPLAGQFLAIADAGEPAAPGMMLGTIRGPDGTMAPLESPCDCVVVQRIAQSGQPYQLGDPLFALIEADQPLMVRAQLSLEGLDGLAIGDRAEIRFPGQAEPIYGEVARIDTRAGLAALRDPDPEAALSRRFARILIRPDRPLGLDSLGSLVQVRFL